MTIALETVYNGDYSAERTLLEIRCGAAVILDKRFITSPPPYARVFIRALPEPERTPTLAFFVGDTLCIRSEDGRLFRGPQGHSRLVDRLSADPAAPEVVLEIRTRESRSSKKRTRI
jgi:hypothetical protein